MMPEKKRPRWRRYLGYGLFFSMVFSVSLYLTFPMEALKPRVVAALEQAVQQAGPSPGRYGSPAEVLVEEVDIYRVSGVQLSNLKVRLASTDPEPSTVWEIDRAQVRLQILPLLLGKRRISFAVDAFSGHVEGQALLVEQRLAELEVEAEEVQLARVPPLADKLGVPVNGALGGTAELKLGKSAKEAIGTVSLKGQGVQLGPGTLKLPVPGIPINCNLKSAIDLGELDVGVKIDEGKLSTERARLVGKDIDLRASAVVTLRQSFRTSPTTGALVLKFDEGLLKREGEVESAIQLAEMKIKKGKDKQGAYHFKLAGTLGTLRPIPDAKAKVN